MEKEKDHLEGNSSAVWKQRNGVTFYDRRLKIQEWKLSLGSHLYSCEDIRGWLFVIISDFHGMVRSWMRTLGGMFYYVTYFIFGYIF